MKNLIGFLAALTFLGMAGGVQAAEATPASQNCALKMVADLPATMGDDGRMFVPVKIEGKTYQFLADTTDIYTWTTEAVAKAVPLKMKAFSPGTITLLTVLGSNISPSLMEVGALRVRGFPVFVSSGPTLTQVGNDIPYWFHWDYSGRPIVSGASSKESDGTLALDWLRDVGTTDLEVNPAGKNIRLFSQAHCPGNVVYWTDQYVDMPMHVPDSAAPIKITRGPVVSVQLDGHSFEAQISTSQVESTISIEAAQELGLDKKDMTEIASANFYAKPYVSDVDRKTYEHQFQSLDIGGIKIVNPTLRVTYFNNSKPQIILGMRHLKNLRLYFAFGEGKLYASAANASK